MPSDPVVVLGFEKAPGVGEKFQALESTEKAKKEIQNQKEGLFKDFKITGNEKTKVNFIVKTDVLGSLEAIENVLKDVPQEKVAINILSFGIGEINDSDVKLAKASKAIILAFRVKTNPAAKKMIERDDVKIMSFEVIYELAQVVRQILERKLKPEIIRKNLGKIKILTIFRTEKNSQIIGGKVLDGEARREAKLEVYRNEEKIGEGKIAKLKKGKEDIESIGKGRECGILYQGNTQLQEDDILEVYIEEKEKTTL